MACANLIHSFVVVLRAPDLLFEQIEVSATFGKRLQQLDICRFYFIHSLVVVEQHRLNPAHHGEVKQRSG